MTAIENDIPIRPVPVKVKGKSIKDELKEITVLTSTDDTYLKALNEAIKK